MKREDNPELKRYILNHLADLYKIREVREPNHLSTYVYCRTKAYFDVKQTAEPTDEEVMLFALGYGLQDVLTPKEAKAPVYQMNGIIYRPDMSITKVKNWDGKVGEIASIPIETAQEVERLLELKTTRKSAKHHFMDEYLPETWLDYMKGGCTIRNRDTYELIVLYMMGNYSPPFPQLYCDKFTFTQEELNENWAKLLSRKEVLDNALAGNKIPTPYENCYDWECKYCRYKLVCETLKLASGKKTKDLKEDEELWT